MPPRIAVPMPHSTDLEYAQRAIPQYERALELAGGVPVRIPLDQSPEELKKLIAGTDGVLLPGSKADVNPARFHQPASPHIAAADSRREELDFFLLDDAYTRRKPVLAICYGLQSLNVYRHGSLIQHIPDFLPEAARNRVNHEAGKTVTVAHTVEIGAESNLRRIVNSTTGDETHNNLTLPVNSSHHQSADKIGEGLRIAARCPDDGIIEALEGTASDHFVLAVQWHPERSLDQDESSRSIFRSLLQAT
ncbi:MAG TPA: gamma-glutamyl-gamma-aminobutyrate hydrolase family protein [Candidatus Sulfotelmatobacter sp.]